MSAVIAKRSSRQKLMVVAGAVGLAFATHGRHACGDVTESWIAGGGGNWTSAANWSPRRELSQQWHTGGNGLSGKHCASRQQCVYGLGK